MLEADADHDGFGDESQDDCPADATRRGPCVVQDSGPGPAQIDSTLPAFLGKPSASPSVFEVNRSGPAETPVTAAAKGTTFRYRLSEPAEVTFAISRATRGRRVGKRCRTQTRGNRKRRRCTRYVAAGAFRDQGVAGQNGKRFSGRIGRKSLKPGRYRATLTAVDAAINRSTPKRIAFRVVKPKRKKR